MASTVDDGGGGGGDTSTAAKMSTTERAIKSQYFSPPVSFGRFAPVEFCPDPLLTWKSFQMRFSCPQNSDLDAIVVICNISLFLTLSLALTISPF